MTKHTGRRNGTRAATLPLSLSLSLSRLYKYKFNSRARILRPRHSAPAKSLSRPLHRRSRIVHSETARARIYGVRIMLESMAEALASS